MSNENEFTLSESSATIVRVGDFAEFGRMAFNIVKDCISEGCCYCDAEMLANLAVKAGLMVYEPYDPAKHDIESSEHKYEPGDMIYYWGKL